MIGHYPHHHSEHEELGKAVDVCLLRRLFVFARPYWRWSVAAFVLAGGITVVELSMPHLVKTVVDSVLVLSWVEITKEAPPVAGAIPIGEGRFLLDKRSLPPGTREGLEAQGVVTSRYLLVP